MRELRQVIRSLLKSPSYLAIAVVMLGLGLGVNSTLFSFANAMLFRPLPGIQDAEGLVLVARTQQNRGFDTLSYPNFRDLRDLNDVFEDFAARRVMLSSFVIDDASRIVPGEMVSWNYFRALRVPLAAGRFFRQQDDTPGTAELTAVISERLWERQWQRSPAAIGAKVTINGHPFTIIGVAGEGFRGAVLPTEVDLWIPWAFEPVFHPDRNLLESRGSSTFHAIARLKPGVSEAAAQANLSALAAQLEKAYPRENEGKGIRVWQYHPFPSPSGFRAASQLIAILVGVAILVLAVVCANLSNLMLARAAAREREMAIRSAVGASRWQILRLMFLEGSILASLGLAASLVLSSWAGAALLRFLPGDHGEPVTLNVSPDIRVAAAAAAVALVCTFLFAALPAWHGARLDLVPALRAGEIAVTPGRSRLRAASLVIQISLCVLLLVGAGLLVRSVQTLREINPGMNVDRLLLVDLDLELNGYTPQRAQQFYTQLQERIAVAPGVRAATLGQVVPLGGRGFGLGGVYGGAVAKDLPLVADANVIGLDYFETLGVAVLQGRDFLPVDAGDTRKVVVLNETMARRMWPEGDALGRSLYLSESGDAVPYEVIGIAANLRYRGLEDADRPFFYLPSAQFPSLRQTLHIRAEQDPFEVIPEVRQIVKELDPLVAVGMVDTMESVLDKSIGLQRLAATLVACCGLLGILVATLGLYGVISFEVTRQTREIGLRMALGASARDVAMQIARYGLRITMLGLGIGLLLALGGAQFLSSLLYGVQPFDPPTYAMVSLLLSVTAVAACLAPAIRAMRVQPVVALRFE